jgi:hypothetical protein
MPLLPRGLPGLTPALLEQAAGLGQKAEAPEPTCAAAGSMTGGHSTGDREASGAVPLPAALGARQAYGDIIEQRKCAHPPDCSPGSTPAPPCCRAVAA